MTPLRIEKSNIVSWFYFYVYLERLSDNEFSLDIFNQKFQWDVQVEMFTQLKIRALL